MHMRQWLTVSATAAVAFFVGCSVGVAVPLPPPSDSVANEVVDCCGGCRADVANVNLCPAEEFDPFLQCPSLEAWFAEYEARTPEASWWDRLWGSLR